MSTVLKDDDRGADVVAKCGGIIRILLLEARKHGIVGSRDNVPLNVSSSFTRDRSIFLSMLSPARDLLAPVMLAHPLAAPAALLGDNLDFSSHHSEGVSMMRKDIVERLGPAHRRLCRRLDEKASRARCECRGHLSGVFLDEVCV